MDPVRAFYDEHPINEAAVLSRLQAEGKPLDALRADDLAPYDQDHYGGVEATEALAAALGLRAGMRVLDVCAGLGGPGRYLAWKYGCRVVGVERHAARCAGAVALTARLGLDDRVAIVQGDATALALEPAAFDAALSQEAFLHIADKAALLGGCHRALRDGGRLAFTDLVATPRLREADRERLRDSIAALSLIPAPAYIGHLEQAGFRQVRHEDLSPWWRRILRARLEMYRGLEAETVRRFGRERHERYVAGYAHFVETIESGRLGGARFVATR